MLARLQRLTTFGLILLAIAVAHWAWRAGRPGLAAAAVLMIAGGHAVVLALEFVWMARANRADPAPAASIGHLLAAWWGEVRAAPTVFCWRQPFRSERWPDQLGADARGRRGVVLVHGFVCNRGLWDRWLAKLTGDGVPFVAVNLEPVFGSIDDYVPIVDAAVARVTQATGRPPVVVAHSMGGLALRRWWAEPGHDDRVHHAITIGTPHHGTALARLAISPNGRQMQIGSRWLTALRSAEPPQRSRRCTCFYGHADNIVFPASNACWPGADARHLAATAHVEMADHPAPYAELRRRLLD